MISELLLARDHLQEPLDLHADRNSLSIDSFLFRPALHFGPGGFADFLDPSLDASLQGAVFGRVRKFAVRPSARCGSFQRQVRFRDPLQNIVDGNMGL